ncbi:tetratricopeptide repeat protein [Niabella hirudinis]|uniref:tetratricopeptide repeat protein n=1 Tax=Niabella hirudinis TaxID=1285929 RepID=UPI003EBA4125
MRQYTSLLPLLLLSMVAFAQQKNPTSVKEIQQKQKEAQAALDKLTPEQKKMMEQMGFSTKVPSMSTGFTDAQVAMAVEGDAVPKRNGAIIDAIPKITLTAATLQAYIKTLNDYIEKNVADNAKIFGQQVYSALKKNKYDATATGNAAIGYWASGNPEIAVYLMGRASADDDSDADLLSNFAAALSMGGAPQKAIPLLEYLNKQYPDNTTILNNLGQAWFYLGDVDRANEKLDKVVKAFVYHPQANYTQCLIQESKGNKAQAIEKMKNSLAYSYSVDKINELRRLGYSVKGSDMRVPFHPDPDPLGLHNFTRPDAPTSYDEELRLGADWDAFQKQAYEKINALSKQELPYLQANNQKAQQTYQQYQNAKGDLSKLTTTPTQKENIYRKTAEKNLQEMSKDGGIAYRLETAKKQIDNLRNDFNAKNEAERKKLEKANKIIAETETEYARRGENIGYNTCVVQKKYSEWVYENYNKPLEEAYKNYLHQMYININEELYWRQFTEDTPVFEAAKIGAKKKWLAALANTRYIATDKYGKCETPKSKDSRYKLADFDDKHCVYKSVLDFGVYKQIIECGKMRVEFDAGRLSGNFNFKAGDDGRDHFDNATLEATVIDKSISTNKGPLQIGASVKAGVGVTFTSHGIEDVYATGEAKVTVKSNIIETFDQHISEASGGDKSQPGMGDAQLSDKGVEIGVSGKMSLISGNTSSNIFVNTPQ